MDDCSEDDPTYCNENENSDDSACENEDFLVQCNEKLQDKRTSVNTVNEPEPGVSTAPVNEISGNIECGRFTNILLLYFTYHNNDKI